MKTKKERKVEDSHASIFKTVIAAATRAIQISEGAEKLVEAKPGDSALNVALKEISRGIVSYKTKEGK